MLDTWRPMVIVVALTPLGPYEIVRTIGRGGVGVVYLARDTKLDRDVAIKCLPDELADDAERMASFEREAKTLASLNHPNIASIYGLEEFNGKRYLILEYVEGQTLAERLSRIAIRLDEAIPCALQIAQAIEAAHAKSIIHRDLTPRTSNTRHPETRPAKSKYSTSDSRRR